MTTKEPLYVKSKIKDYIKAKGLNSSGELIDGTDRENILNDLITEALDKAADRAKANNRKTLMPKDL